jgi:hypothetical protein
MTVHGVVPPPPPGPGVQPPFVAPPTDGVRRRRWVAIGITGVVVVLVCAGAVVGLGALGIFGEQMVADKSKAAVQTYLDQIKGRGYSGAYDLLCADERNRVDEGELSDDWDARGPIGTFTVGDPNLNEAEVIVPVEMEFTDGHSMALRFPVEQNGSTGKFQVCSADG